MELDSLLFNGWEPLFIFGACPGANRPLPHPHTKLLTSKRNL